MAQPMILSEIKHDTDCQLASFTNKLPYYVRQLYETNNKNKQTPAAHSYSSKYLKSAYNQSVVTY